LPIYGYSCTACEKVHEGEASMSSFKEHHPNCPSCGSTCNYVWIPSVPQVALKDGPSGSWPSKGERFKNFRAKQSETMGKRQRDRYGEVKSAVPNYMGQETSSWAEARESALKERGAASAATYDAKVSEEKAAKPG